MSHFFLVLVLLLCIDAFTQEHSKLSDYDVRHLQTFPVTDISHVGHHHENCCKNVKIAAKELRGLIGY